MYKMKIRERPPEGEAVRLAGWNAPEVAEWCGGKVTDNGVAFKNMSGRTVQAQTLDFIVRWCGDFYAVDPDWFASRYVVVDDDEGYR